MHQKIPDEKRKPIWTVAAGQVSTYLALFITFSIALTAFFIAHDIFTTQNSTLKIAHTAFLYMSNTFTAAAGLALITTEAPRGIMVLAHLLTEKYLDPLREKHRRDREEKQAKIQAEIEARIRPDIQDQIMEEIDTKLLAWDTRRLEAQAAGTHFHEPIPTTRPAPRS